VDHPAARARRAGAARRRAERGGRDGVRARQLQAANHGDADLLVYVHGWPAEAETAELLPSAV
jgi:hypothetical protein